MNLSALPFLFQNTGFSTGNSTPSNETHGDEEENNSLAMIVKIISCSTIGTLSIVGNILVIFVVVRVARMKTTTFYLIVNMSISDILFAVIAMPVFILEVKGDTSSFSETAVTFVCKFVNPASFGLMVSSVLTMTAIALDRFFAVKRPLQVMVGMKKLKLIIVSIWTSSLLVSLPMMYSYKLQQEDGFYWCDEQWSSSVTDNEVISRVYTVILFIIIYFIPFTTMAVLYFIVGHHLWFRKIPNHFHPIQRYLIISRRRVVRMLVAVLLCFVLCWLPLQVITFLFYFHEGITLSPGLRFTAEFLIRANGAINPCLYVFFSRVFRKAAMRAFQSIKRKKFVSTKVFRTKTKCSATSSMMPSSSRIGSFKSTKKQETCL